MNDLSFNQDFTCLLVSTTKSHQIFNCDPFGELYALSGLSATDDAENVPGTALLRMLFLTSLTIIVPYPHASGTTNRGRVLQIHNLKQNTQICELEFPLAVRDVRLNRRRLLVFVEAGQIYIYDLSSVRLVKVLDVNGFVDTDPGLAGARVTAALSPDDASLLVLPLLAVNEQTDILNAEAAGSDLAACLPTDPELLSAVPGLASAPWAALAPYIEPMRLSESERLAKTLPDLLAELQRNPDGWVLVYDTMRLRPRLVYKAHDSPVAQIAISSGSGHIATASTKGTIVRVAHVCKVTSFDTPLEKLQISHITNLRRGHNPTRINALTFSLDLEVLGCGSESGTVHLFTIQGTGPLCLPLPETLGSPQDLHLDNEAIDEESGARLSSLEDLNENLANLLLLKEPDEPLPRSKHTEEGSSYLSAFKTSLKLISNLYTKLFMKRLPYKEYLKNLIWEKPRRSFAYAKIPSSGVQSAQPMKAEIGFSGAGVLMLASYNTGKLYQYRIPGEEAEERVECTLLQLNKFY